MTRNTFEQHREAVLAIAPDGTGVSAPLDQIMDSLAAVLLDDSIAEGPRARVHRLARHALGAGWPWLAASMRLDQGIADCRHLITSTSVSLEVLWCGYTSILRLRGSKLMKLTRKKLCDYVYRMSFAHDAGLGAEPADAQGGESGGDDDGGGDDEGDDGEGPRDSAGGGHRGRARPGRGGAVGGGSGGGFPVSEASSSAVGPRTEDTNRVRLLRQYLAASLKVHGIISLEVLMEEGENSLMFSKCSP